MAGVNSNNINSTSASSSGSASASTATGPAKRSIKYKLDFEKSVLLRNCEKRAGWVRTSHETEWNVWWASVGAVHQLFNPDANGGYRLSDDQIINHFPNHYELTRKDLMVKHMKRYRRAIEKEHSALAEKDANGSYVHLDLLPVTYVLPSDYSLFVEEFKKNDKALWILKPCAKSQGAGVFLINKLSTIKKWAASIKLSTAAPATNAGRDGYVVSRYVERPLLIGGKKFDLRVYVLVTSYRPLKIYLYRDAFARFCNIKYSLDPNQIDNPFVHLTNVAIQKHGGEAYNSAHGNKWSVNNLRLYLEATRGQAITRRVFDAMQSLIVHSCRAVQPVIMNDRHCFECYGYDLLLDEQLKPWLLEINASPSLSTTTPPDHALKLRLIDDIFKVVIPPDFAESKTGKGGGVVAWNSARTVGAFDMIYDETNPSDVERFAPVTVIAEAEAAAASTGTPTAAGSATAGTAAGGSASMRRATASGKSPYAWTNPATAPPAGAGAVSKSVTAASATANYSNFDDKHSSDAAASTRKPQQPATANQLNGRPASASAASASAGSNPRRYSTNNSGSGGSSASYGGYMPSPYVGHSVVNPNTGFRSAAATTGGAAAAAASHSGPVPAPPPVSASGRWR